MQALEQFMRTWPTSAKSFAFDLAIAFPFIVFVCWCGGKLYLRHRRRRDQESPGQKNRRSDLFLQFELGPLPESSDIKRMDGSKAKAQWRTLHQKAISDKNKYLELVGRCGLVLAILLFSLAVSLTIAKSNSWLLRLISVIDVIAILYFLFYWWRARQANKKWVMSRILAELTRQRLSLSVLAIPAEIAQSQDISGFFDQIKAIIIPDDEPLWTRAKNALGIGPTSEQLDARIRKYWDHLKLELTQFPAPTNSDDAKRSRAHYLWERPIRQLEWFRMRQNQLSNEGRSRGRTLITLYFISLILAIVVLLSEHPFLSTAISSALNLDNMSQVTKTIGSINFQDLISLLLLTTSALSAALTYWFLSRNERSLNHRYKTQIRQIETWLSSLRHRSNGGAAHLEWADIEAFERTMIGDVIDWTHITSNDIAELGA